jgi:hypothetical protein
MDQQPTTDIVRHFEGLSDPRTGNAKTHIFLEILIIAIYAVICGAGGWSDIELFTFIGDKKQNLHSDSCRSQIPLLFSLSLCAAMCFAFFFQ